MIYDDFEEPSQRIAAFQDAVKFKMRDLLYAVRGDFVRDNLNFQFGDFLDNYLKHQGETRIVNEPEQVFEGFVAELKFFLSGNEKIKMANDAQEKFVDDLFGQKGEILQTFRDSLERVIAFEKKYEESVTREAAEKERLRKQAIEAGAVVDLGVWRKEGKG